MHSLRVSFMPWVVLGSVMMEKSSCVVWSFFCICLDSFLPAGMVKRRLSGGVGSMQTGAGRRSSGFREEKMRDGGMSPGSYPSFLYALHKGFYNLFFFQF